MTISNLLFNKQSKKSVSQDTKAPAPILIIDGSVLVYQAFYSVGYLSYNGRATGVIYGFLRNILSLSKKFQTNDFIICWDSKSSHRKEIYPEYKKRRRQNKEKTIEDKIAYDSLILQKKELAENILPAIGFNNNFEQEGFEGDDLLAYWVIKLKRKKIMVTTDADMYQCLDYCTIWNPQKKKYFTKKHLIKEFGITPDKWAWAKAIGGCSGDEVQGIEGVSDPKKSTSKALKYIQNKLNKGIVLDRIKSDEGQKIIKRNLPLVTLPFKHGAHKLERMALRRNTFSRTKFLQAFDRLHFKSLLENDTFQYWEKFISL